ncbi:MAG: GTPase domain-containing protein [Nitrococcus sp.]|nr:GTPase domain-containing protein [Nitrococcus sp.]
MSQRLPLWRRWWAVLLALGAVVLPFLALIPFGALWLWEQGWTLAWLGTAGLLGLGGYGYARWLRRQAKRAQASWQVQELDEALAVPDADWLPRDLAAWDTVQALAARVDKNIVADHRLLLATARRVIEQVAQHYHPEDRHPIWRFTVPEALLLTERVSARLRQVLLNHVPGSHMIRAGQLLRLWELKPTVQRGAQVYRSAILAYRLARLMNPGLALLAEAREHLFSAALGDAGDYLRRKGAQIWVEEVGRAAIELYSGRLRVDAEELHEVAEREPLGPGVKAAELPGPLRLVVGGQTKAGKSSLVNALLGEMAAGVDVLPLTTACSGYELRRDGVAEALIIDTPGLDGAETMDRVVDCACDGDCLLWVVAAHRADRALDRTALAAVSARFAADLRRIQPPLLVVASHVDRLSPAREWTPPYDVNEPARSKEIAMREAMEVIAADLQVPIETVVPVRLDPPAAVYNIELLWALLMQRFERARRGRALRISQSISQRQWKRVLQQAARAGLGVSRDLLG